MRRPWILPVLSALGAIVLLDRVSAQDRPATGRPPIVTVTRLVKLFSGLENEWLTAVRNRDETALTGLLADDFEMRLAARPGQPTPRAEWIRQALASSPATWTIHQIAARDLGSVVVVSFRLDPATSAHGGRPAFIVDTWVQVEGNWKVAARYVAPADERTLGLPGEAAASTDSPSKKP